MTLKEAMKRIEELEKRVKTLEARGGVTERHVYEYHYHYTQPYIPEPTVQPPWIPYYGSAITWGSGSSGPVIS